MSSIITPEETLIDLLPASDFNGRKVKVHWKDSKTSHPSAAVCRGPGDKGQIVVEVSGTGQGKKTFQVASKRVEPWWSQNPDLKAKRDQILLESRTPGSMAEAIDKAVLSSTAGEARESSPKRKAVVLSVPAPVVRAAPSANRPAEPPCAVEEAVAPPSTPTVAALPAEARPTAEEPAQEAAAPAVPPAKVAPVRYDYQNFHGVTAPLSADPRGLPTSLSCRRRSPPSGRKRKRSPS